MSCARGCCPTQREHYKSLRYGLDRMQRLSNGYTLASIDRENKDMEAYARLRKNGVQPPDWTGCAELEQRAETRTEIEHGTVLNRRQRTGLEDAL